VWFQSKWLCSNLYSESTDFCSFWYDCDVHLILSNHFILGCITFLTLILYTMLVCEINVNLSFRFLKKEFRLFNPKNMNKTNCYSWNTLCYSWKFVWFFLILMKYIRYCEKCSQIFVYLFFVIRVSYIVILISRFFWTISFWWC